MNVSKFKGAVAAAGYTLSSLAFEMHMAVSTMSRKLRNDGFTIAEANQIVRILHIKDPVDIFFDLEVT